MKFTKMHGLGNDYVFVDVRREAVPDPTALARRISDRHTGVGSDGLILVGGSETADVSMIVYNSDGSRAQMCGNGIRCVAKYAVDQGLASGPAVRIETDAGVKVAECRLVGGRVNAVRVDMGRPSLSASKIPSTISTDRIINHLLRLRSRTLLAFPRVRPADDGEPLALSCADTESHDEPWTSDCANVGGTDDPPDSAQVAVDYTVTCVSMGNPHAVVFVEGLDTVELEMVGPMIEHAPEFPERINAHFVRVDSPGHVTMKTWERGSGVTRACGTGACAVCVAGALTRRAERKITANLPGGDLQLEWLDNDHVYMTGPATEVFTGEWPE